MSFTNFLRCCFPNKKEQIIITQEEDYEAKSSSDDRSKNEKDLENQQENIEKSKNNISFTNTNLNEDTNKKANNIINKQNEINDSFGSFRLKNNNNDDNNNNLDNFNNGMTNNIIIDVGSSKKNVTSILNKKNNANDDSTIDLMNSQRQITDEEIKKAPHLLLEELTGESLRNNKLKINAGGLTNGLRKMRDGVTFFGKNSENIINDFDLNLEPGSEFPSHIFIIYYRRDLNKFFLKCYKDKIHKGQIYVKIHNEDEFKIVKKEIVLLSETYFQIIPLPDGKLEIQNLGTNNKESEGPAKFLFDQNDIKTFTLGRDSKCQISFSNDKSFSKVQATFNYDDENKIWKLIDGMENKPSTNGCWIYATHSYEVFDNTVFQFGSSKMRISIV